MYPNELDDEMKNYKYGDKLYPQYNYYGGYGNGYGGYGGGYGGNNTYGGNNGYYNNPWLYGSSNYMDYWNNQNTFAPPFDPDSHFKSPYYHYEDKYNYWGNYNVDQSKLGYWQPQGYDNYNPKIALLTQVGNQTMPSLPPPDVMNELIKSGKIPPPPTPELLAELIKNGTVSPPQAMADKPNDEDS